MNNQNKIISLLIAVVACVSVFVIITVVVSSSDQQPPVDSREVLTQDSLKNIKSQTEGLVNYGDLPVSALSTEIGRNDPFDSY